MIGRILAILPGIYLGWGLGSNNAANVFGPPVGAGIVKYRQAIALTAIFVMAGAFIEGEKCLDTIGGLSKVHLTAAVLITLAAAITVNVLTYLRLPISTSQAIVGAIMGISVVQGTKLEHATLIKIVLCWLFTPFGAAIIAFVLYIVLRWIWVRRVTDLQTFNKTIRYGSILIGCYAAYNLGANNLANVTGIYVGAGFLSPGSAVLIGGISIAVGVVTYSGRVMMTVGKSITPLDPFSGLVALLAEALTLHIYTQIGVPVSSSQAIVGAVVGVGMVHGFHLINRKTLLGVLVGWLATFGASAVLAAVFLLVARPILG
ncbi:MAG: inorganic phosphate transporter [Planctomycetes bacterium]|nr:inorganic phosphate transporter [Planctomycetota bacterium]